MCCLDIQWNQRALGCLPKYLPILFLRIRSPGHITLLVRGNRHSSCLCLVSVACQSTELFSQLHPSTGTREHPHSRHDKDYFPQSLIVYSVPKNGLVLHVIFSCTGLWVYVTNKLLSILSQCQVSGMDIPRNIGQESFSHRWLNRSYL